MNVNEFLEGVGLGITNNNTLDFGTHPDPDMRLIFHFSMVKAIFRQLELSNPQTD